MKKCNEQRDAVTIQLRTGAHGVAELGEIS